MPIEVYKQNLKRSLQVCKPVRCNDCTLAARGSHRSADAASNFHKPVVEVNEKQIKFLAEEGLRCVTALEKCNVCKKSKVKMFIAEAIQAKHFLIMTFGEEAAAVGLPTSVASGLNLDVVCDEITSGGTFLDYGLHNFVLSQRGSIPLYRFDRPQSRCHYVEFVIALLAGDARPGWESWSSCRGVVSLQDVVFWFLDCKCCSNNHTCQWTSHAASTLESVWERSGMRFKYCAREAQMAAGSASAYTEHIWHNWLQGSSSSVVPMPKAVLPMPKALPASTSGAGSSSSVVASTSSSSTSTASTSSSSTSSTLGSASVIIKPLLPLRPKARAQPKSPKWQSI